MRVIDNLRRKQSATAASNERVKPADPFLDYDPELYVEDTPPAHRVLLNKFNVIERHALIVTRAFALQTAPLTPGDMQAALGCLAEWDGLLFYNGGEQAGASQPHKHLQMVPKTLGPEGIPLEPQIKAALADPAALPFALAELISDGASRLLDMPELERPMNDDSRRRELYLPFSANAYVLRYRLHGDIIVVIRVWRSLEQRE